MAEKRDQTWIFEVWYFWDGRPSRAFKTFLEDICRPGLGNKTIPLVKNLGRRKAESYVYTDCFVSHSKLLKFIQISCRFLNRNAFWDDRFTHFVWKGELFVGIRISIFPDPWGRAKELPKINADSRHRFFEAMIICWMWPCNSGKWRFRISYYKYLQNIIWCIYIYICIYT